MNKFKPNKNTRKTSIDLVLVCLLLIHVMPQISFYTPWNHQKTRAFLMFSGGAVRQQWHEMGWAKLFQDGRPYDIDRRPYHIIMLCKSMDWFLYDRSLCHERVNRIQKSISCYYSSFELLIPVEHWLLPPGN